MTRYPHTETRTDRLAGKLLPAAALTIALTGAAAAFTPNTPALTATIAITATAALTAYTYVHAQHN